MYTFHHFVKQHPSSSSQDSGALPPGAKPLWHQRDNSRRLSFGERFPWCKVQKVLVRCLGLTFSPLWITFLYSLQKKWTSNVLNFRSSSSSALQPPVGFILLLSFCPYPNFLKFPVMSVPISSSDLPALTGMWLQPLWSPETAQPRFPRNYTLLRSEIAISHFSWHFINIWPFWAHRPCSSLTSIWLLCPTIFCVYALPPLFLLVIFPLTLGEIWCSSKFSARCHAPLCTYRPNLPNSSELFVISEGGDQKLNKTI